jgi:hypothetical protein
MPILDQHRSAQSCPKMTLPIHGPNSSKKSSKTK